MSFIVEHFIYAAHELGLAETGLSDSFISLDGRYYFVVLLQFLLDVVLLVLPALDVFGLA